MKLRWILSAAACCGALASAACASSSGGSGPRKVSESSQDKVTSVEITGTPASSAYDLVYRLRPQWLRAGPTGSIGGGIRNQITLVYLDGNKLGGIEALRSVSASGIRAMEWISAGRAAVTLSDVGSEPISGAISLHTR